MTEENPGREKPGLFFLPVRKILFFKIGKIWRAIPWKFSETRKFWKTPRGKILFRKTSLLFPPFFRTGKNGLKPIRKKPYSKTRRPCRKIPCLARSGKNSFSKRLISDSEDMPFSKSGKIWFAPCRKQPFSNTRKFWFTGKISFQKTRVCWQMPFGKTVFQYMEILVPSVRKIRYFKTRRTCAPRACRENPVEKSGARLTMK